MTRFDTCLQFILSWEGGNSDDPVDRGGRTSRGITQRTYDDYRRSRGLPLRDVWIAEDLEVKDIYIRNYWIMSGCQWLFDPIDLIVFDAAVNTGCRRATRWLQTALGMDEGEIDGVIGKHTLVYVSDAKASNDIDRVCKRFIELRRKHYEILIQKDPSQKRFKNGWENRVASLEKEVNLA